MAENESPNKDWWDKLEAFAKIVAAGGAVIGAVLIPWVINSLSERNRNAQVLLQTMTERERSDTDVRAKMFDRLMINYLGEFKVYATKDDLRSFQEQVMILELLTVNFQDFFNSRPLFEEVHKRLVSQKADKLGWPRVTCEETAERLHAQKADPLAWRQLECDLFRAARNVARGQVLTLDALGPGKRIVLPVGHTCCLRMYSNGEIAALSKHDRETLKVEDYKEGACSEKGSDVRKGPAEDVERSDVRRSIELYVRSVNHGYLTAAVIVTRQEDVFRKHFLSRQYDHSRVIGATQLDVSFFDLPYMDNMRLSDGSRVSLTLHDVYAEGGEDVVELDAVQFRSDYVSLQDRPVFEDMLRRLGAGTTLGASR